MKTRGLKEARKKLGDVEGIISKLLKKKKKIKIFESGCGYGRLMIDLIKKYGGRVEIIGMNLKKQHGNKDKMISLALSKKVFKRKDLKKIKIPKIIYGDAGKKLPFETGSIDLVLSQTSCYLYGDKLHFFEEVARILSKGGVARITSCFFMEEFPKEYQETLRIYKNGKQIHAKKFVKKFKQIEIKKLKNKKQAIEIKSGRLKLRVLI
jgi:ubiquinone/menaquinone biosynthesis C-methylase UbiE